MKPVTYLCFTLLSIITQFCLMDFINGKVGVDTVIDSNSSIANNLSNIFRNMKQKQHALYYRTEKSTLQLKNKSMIKYKNGSLSGASLLSTTELASTVFDLLYDDNMSVTYTESELSTDTLFTTEFDNVTEITFFDEKPSTNKPTDIPKKISTNKCYCNLLYKACDINCCCDNDCSDLEKSMLKRCKEIGKEKCDLRNKEYLSMCSSQLACSNELQSDVFGYLFCIGKVNLPEKRKNIANVLYASDIDNRLQWHTIRKKSKTIKFTKAVYTTDQPIWLVTNGTIETLELPITVTNEYCNGYQAVKFLTNQYIKCYVRLKDLHMLDIIKSSERTKIASAKESTINSTTMDCTTLYCTNWTLLICDEHKCTEYVHELHEPSCTESYCNNIGVKIEYEFYCNVTLITRATVKFHVRTISMAFEFVTQEITVNFFMGNNSIDKIIKFSGNPGYIRGLPIIVSLFEGNHTENFYNNSIGSGHYLALPYNKEGKCVLTNLTHNVVKFGYNKRMICRAHFEHNFSIHNGTDGCLKIQAKIDKLYGLSSNIFISPYGNPQDISDENWISLQKFDKSNIYGEYRTKDSKLLCYNLITGITFIMTFADTGNATKEDNKILKARVDSISKNITFSIEDLSTAISIDTIYVDARKPNVNEYVVAPHLNVPLLSKDWFYPASSSSVGSLLKFQMIVLCLNSFVF